MSATHKLVFEPNLGYSKVRRMTKAETVYGYKMFREGDRLIALEQVGVIKPGTIYNYEGQDPEGLLVRRDGGERIVSVLRWGLVRRYFRKMGRHERVE